MKKRIKILLTTFFLLLLNIDILKANSLESLNIEASLDNNGTIHITEIWDMITDKDTEIYKQEFDLGNMIISNFKVKDEKTEYKKDYDWNINGSFDYKKNKYGINYVDDGLELCWGISEYGKKTYTISYDIENAIFNTEDAQVFYMKLINQMSFSPKKVNVKLTGPYYYDDILDVWGYGYKGYAYVSDGAIYASNEENTSFINENYMVLLIKYPVNTFNTDNSYSMYQSFSDVLNKANEGTFSYDYEETEDGNKGIFASYLIIFSCMIGFISFFKKINNKNNIFKFGSKGQKIKMKDINMFRDIPCEKDIFKAYFLTRCYKLNKRETDFLGAVILKWVKEDKLVITKNKVKNIFGKEKEEPVFDIKNYKIQNTMPEDNLFQMMNSASSNGILEKNDFPDYCKKHYNKFNEWFEETLEYGASLYQSDGLVTSKRGKYYIDDKLKDEGVKLAGLKKFLIEFSNMKEKKPIEVKLWDEYLIFAQIFGIADKVIEQFKKFYPEVLEDMETRGMGYNNIILVRNYSSSAVRSASEARMKAESYSSGGGGFSSGGGGGGSFGGGGGGSR